MVSLELKDSICRICLDENVISDWNDSLDEYQDVTYKDCYYTYTKLNCPDNDPFSCMLCQDCKNTLEKMHALIIKAIDSYNFLIEVNCNDTKMEDDFSMISEVVEDIQNNQNDFETVLVEKVEESDLQDTIEELLNESTESEKTLVPCESSIEIEVFTEEDYNSKDFSEIDYSYDDDVTSSSENVVTTEPPTNSTAKRKATSLLSSNVIKKFQVKPKNRRSVHNSENGKKSNSQNTPSMCSICSKILRNKYSLQKHEKTHIENRERKETCPICGVKFFDRTNLVNHMHIHDEKREKKHKCEFCDKDFFNKGTLNVHRRVHLGQMIPCTLCSKEFYRKVDLEIHMNSHSEIPVSSNRKRRSRYFARCPHCHEDVLSTNYRSHVAAHLNEPLFKCLVCEKGFFKRTSCTTHVKEVHKKSKEEYNDYIEILYDNKRLSHLFLAQTTVLKPGYED